MSVVGRQVKILVEGELVKNHGGEANCIIDDQDEAKRAVCILTGLDENDIEADLIDVDASAWVITITHDQYHEMLADGWIELYDEQSGYRFTAELP